MISLPNIIFHWYPRIFQTFLGCNCCAIFWELKISFKSMQFWVPKIFWFKFYYFWYAIMIQLDTPLKSVGQIISLPNLLFRWYLRLVRALLRRSLCAIFLEPEVRFKSMKILAPKTFWFIFIIVNVKWIIQVDTTV